MAFHDCPFSACLAGFCLFGSFIAADFSLFKLEETVCTPDGSAVVFSLMSISFAMVRHSSFYGAMTGVMGNNRTETSLFGCNGRSCPFRNIPLRNVIAFLLSPIFAPLAIMLFFYVVGLALDVIDCIKSL